MRLLLRSMQQKTSSSGLEQSIPPMIGRYPQIRTRLRQHNRTRPRVSPARQLIGRCGSQSEKLRQPLVEPLFPGSLFAGSTPTQAPRPPETRDIPRQGVVCRNIDDISLPLGLDYVRLDGMSRYLPISDTEKRTWFVVFAIVAVIHTNIRRSSNAFIATEDDKASHWHS